MTHVKINMQKIMILKQALLAVSVTAVLGLTGCSDSDDPAADTETFSVGVFLDAPVKGLTYETTSTETECASAPSGTTNESGEFNYKDNCKVTFKMAGLNIGELSGASTVLVTDLPNGMEVAQLLQSFDTDSDTDIIDISTMNISNEDLSNIQTDFSNIGDSTIDTVFTSINTANMSQGNESATLVSASDAETHVGETVSSVTVEWDPDEVNDQVFVDMTTKEMFTFPKDQTGIQYKISSFFSYNWAFSTDRKKLDITEVGSNSPFSMSLLSSSTNEYAVATDDLKSKNLIKAKELTLAQLDGKILLLDGVTDVFCNPSTLKFENNIAYLKESCGETLEESSYTVSADETLKNVINLTDTTGNTSFLISIVLLKGDLTEGTLGVLIDEMIELETFKATSEELSEPSDVTLTNAFFEGKTFIERNATENNETGTTVVTFFDEGKAEKVYDFEGEGEAVGKEGTEKFIWSITSDNQLKASEVDDDTSNYELITFFPDSESNEYIITTTDIENETVTRTETDTVYQAKPLALAQLANITLKFKDCHEIEFDTTGKTAVYNSECGTEESSGINITVTEDASLDNIVILTSHYDEGDEISIFGLVHGDLSKGTFFDMTTDSEDGHTANIDIIDFTGECTTSTVWNDAQGACL
jgi:hypothetical protein